MNIQGNDTKFLRKKKKRILFLYITSIFSQSFHSLDCHWPPSSASYIFASTTATWSTTLVTLIVSIPPSSWTDHHSHLLWAHTNFPDTSLLLLLQINIVLSLCKHYLFSAYRYRVILLHLYIHTSILVTTACYIIAVMNLWWPFTKS